MNRWIKAPLKAILKPLWRLSAPVRRPLLRKFDEHLAHALAQNLIGPSARLEATHAAVAGALVRLEGSLQVGRHVVEHQNADANLLLDGLVREVARLQLQIEALREAIDEAQGRGSLGLVGQDDESARKAG